MQKNQKNQESSLIKKLENRKMKARLSKNQDELSFISFILGEIQTIGKNDGNRDTTHEEALSYIKGYIKKRQGYKELMIKNDKTIEANTASKEIDYLQELIEAYIPKELNEKEHEALIKNLIDKGASNIGEIMKALKGLDGVNMQMASKIAKKSL